jgi:hypothetical protein
VIPGAHQEDVVLTCGEVKVSPADAEPSQPAIDGLYSLGMRSCGRQVFASVVFKEVVAVLFGKRTRLPPRDPFAAVDLFQGFVAT